MDLKNNSQGGMVLVVDDQQDNRRLLRAYLERLSLGVREAESAAEARTVLNKEQIDAMICDISMPVESGLEFIQALRTSDQKKLSNLPVAALSAHAANEDRQTALSAGFDFYLTKPIYFQDLSQAVHELMEKAKELPTG